MNCMHGGCLCEVRSEEEFCSDYCRNHATEAEHAEHDCGCGHDACQL